MVREPPDGFSRFAFNNRPGGARGVRRVWGPGGRGGARVFSGRVFFVSHSVSLDRPCFLLPDGGEPCRFVRLVTPASPSHGRPSRVRACLTTFLSPG